MDIFILMRQSHFSYGTKGVFSSMELALQALERELELLISEPEDSVNIKRQTPENTKPWHWPNIVYAVNLSQFTWEAGDVVDWLVIEKWPLQQTAPER